MTDKEKIRAEIERLKKENNGSPLSVCNDLLSFIDSMPVEPKFKVGDVVRSKNNTILTIIGMGQYCYHCDNDYSFGFNIQDEFELVEESASDDLEEVAGNYAMNELNVFGNQDGWTENGAVYDMIKATARHFAIWQKQQIMNNATDGYIDQVEYPGSTLIQLSENPKDFNNGEDVKVIIIKK